MRASLFIRPLAKLQPETLAELKAEPINRRRFLAVSGGAAAGLLAYDRIDIGGARAGIPMTPDSMMVWFSMSKAATAVCTASSAFCRAG